MLRRLAFLFGIAPMLTWVVSAAQLPRPHTYPPELPWPSIPQIRFQRGDDPRWQRRISTTRAGRK